MIPANGWGEWAEPVRGWHPAARARRHTRTRRRREGVGLVLMLLCALTVGLFLPRDKGTDTVRYAASVPAAARTVQIRALPPGVDTGFPEGESTCTLSFPREKLLAGRMMLVDATHPLPADVIIPNTFGVLKYTSGRVSCRDGQAVLGEEALCALDALFTDARREKINTLTVFAATRSQEQQRQLLTDKMSSLARDMPLEDALRLARAAVDEPDCSEHQTGWAADLRICAGWNDPPSASPLSASTAGQWLLNNAWRYGWIRRYPDADPDDEDKAYHFRYVGKAHAALMHAMDMTMEDYLAYLHEHGTVTLTSDEGAPVATAVCVELGEGGAAFPIPLHGHIEDASLDNQGWAVVSCLYDCNAK